MSLNSELSLGIQKMGLTIDLEQQDLLLGYVALLNKWNKVYNLTAIRDPHDMISHHLLDSLSVLPYLWSGRWLDVGCGAGLPGVVLAIACPHWQFTLLDSNSKKTGFVQQAVIELGIKNVSVCCSRVEDFTPNDLFDGIISRAFTELGGFVKATAHLKAENGRWAAMKGWGEKELSSLPQNCQVESIVPLHVPGLDAARSLIVVSGSGAKHHD